MGGLWRRYSRRRRGAGRGGKSCTASPGVTRIMKTPASRNRKPGRPAIRKDKNGLPRPVRPDRDRAIKTFFDSVPRPDFDDAMQMSGDKRFYRLHDALHDDAYRHTSPGTLCRKFGI